MVNHGDVEVGDGGPTAVVGPDRVGRLRPQFGRCSPNGSVAGLEGQDRSEELALISHDVISPEPVMVGESGRSLLAVLLVKSKSLASKQSLEVRQPR